MAQTKIEWTGTEATDGSILPGFTFNAWIGCTKVSEGCKNCYAEADMGDRRKRVIWGANGTRSVTSYSYWRQALSWNAAAGIKGERRKVFCSSLADIFEDWQGTVLDSKNQVLWWSSEWSDAALKLSHTCEGISGETNYGGEKYCDVDGIPTFSHWNEEYMATHLNSMNGWVHLNLNTIREYLFRLIQMTPNLDWLLLTKRPENVMRMVPEHWRIKFPANVWLGFTVENQNAANERIALFTHIPAKVKFLSIEPMLGPVDLVQAAELYLKNTNGNLCNLFNWVICGGESGPKKRPFNIAWAESLTKQCSAGNVAFFMKQIDKVQAIPDHLMVREFPRL